MKKIFQVSHLKAFLNPWSFPRLLLSHLEPHIWDRMSGSRSVDHGVFDNEVRSLACLSF